MALVKCIMWVCHSEQTWSRRRGPSVTQSSNSAWWPVSVTTQYPWNRHCWWIGGIWMAIISITSLPSRNRETFLGIQSRPAVRMSERSVWHIFHWLPRRTNQNHMVCAFSKNLPCGRLGMGFQKNLHFSLSSASWVKFRHVTLRLLTQNN